MRILHYNHTSTVSGAEISLLTLAAALGRHHEVVIAAPEGELLDRAREQGINSVVCPGTSGSLKLHPVRTPMALGAMVVAGVRLARICRRREIDVLHANSPRSGLVGVVARWTGGPPMVVHVRDASPRSRATTAVLGLLGRSAWCLVAISAFVATNIRGVAGDGPRVVTIYNPVRSDVFFPDATDAQKTRDRLGLPANAPVLAVVGQITSWKRQHLAIEVLAALRRELPEARLLIVGEVKFDSADTALDNPAYLSRLVARSQAEDVRGFVELLGDRRDVASIMRAVDVLLAPAEREPFGRSVAEALVSGTPVIAPDGPGGPGEFLRHGKDGSLVGPCDLDAWAAAARRWIAAPELKADACERARTLFSVDLHAERIALVLQQAAPRASGSTESD